MFAAIPRAAFTWLAPCLLVAVCARTASAQCPYERAGWSTQLSELFHNVSGRVTIVDERTLQVENFTYDGGGPAVYFYLGASNTNASFAAGLEIPPTLTGTPYNGGSLTLSLPAGETLDGYNAISVWCDDFSVNFGSGTFAPPVGGAYERAGYTAELSTNFHNVSGEVTVVTDRMLHVKNFTYDGQGIDVRFYLGASNSSASFAGGIPIGPQLVGPSFNGDSLVVALPDGQSLDGYNAISVWCIDFSISFGSGSFLPPELPAGDFNGDCAVTAEDMDGLTHCLGGPDVTPTPPAPNDAADCLDAFDADVDGDVDLADFAEFTRIYPAE